MVSNFTTWASCNIKCILLLCLTEPTSASTIASSLKNSFLAKFLLSLVLYIPIWSSIILSADPFNQPTVEVIKLNAKLLSLIKVAILWDTFVQDMAFSFKSTFPPVAFKTPFLTKLLSSKVYSNCSLSIL